MRFFADPPPTISSSILPPNHTYVGCQTYPAQSLSPAVIISNPQDRQSGCREHEFPGFVNQSRQGRSIRPNRRSRDFCEEARLTTVDQKTRDERIPEVDE